MKALRLVKYGDPKNALEFAEVEAPAKDSIKSTEVYIKVCAVSVNPLDWKIVLGNLKPLWSLNLPCAVGYDLSGTVEAVGSSVTKFNVGDEVISRVFEMGTFQEYVVVDQRYIAHKPASIPLVESAGIPLAALTALECFESLNMETRNFNKAFVPAGLGGVGSYATQILSNVFKIPVATTVSTGKVERMRSLVPDIEIVDYKKEDYTTKLSNVDFIFDTTGDVPNEAKIVAQNGVIRSIGSSMPSSEVAAERFNGVPFYVKYVLDFVEWKNTRGLCGKNVDYKYFWLTSNGERLQRVSNYIEEDKIQVITDCVYEWKDAKFAYAKAINGGSTGKIIVKVAE